MTRRYARGVGGARIAEGTPQGHWKILTILGAMSTRGILAAMTIEEATDRDIFLTYLDQVLCPKLRPDDVVVMDNLSAHKVKGVRERIEAVGARLLYLPPYSPDLNPIEKAWAKLKNSSSRLIGPNCPGLITPARCSAGIMPADVFLPGHTGLISRSGTLTYEVVYELTRAGLGQSTCVGMGGDPLHGLGFLECLELYEADAETEAVVLIGEIGGDDEERAAAFVRDHMTKPVVAYIAGFSAPPGKRMGHAGAIVEGSSGTAAEKKAALEAAGIPVAAAPADVVPLLRQRLEGRRTE